MADSISHPVEDGMDEDEALRYAIALSLQDQEHQSTADTTEASPSGSKGVSFGSLALDRKKMEEERLQRLAKRRRSNSDGDVVEVPPPKRKIPPELSSAARAVPYPSGTVKRTWARGYPRTSEDIRIEEVLQKDHLQLALLSSFQWDEEWMLSKINLNKTKLLLAAFATDESQV